MLGTLFPPTIFSIFTLFKKKSTDLGIASVTAFVYTQTEHRRPVVVGALIFQEFNFNFTLQ